jgi:hypothetical protein
MIDSVISLYLFSDNTKYFILYAMLRYGELK